MPKIEITHTERSKRMPITYTNRMGRHPKSHNYRLTVKRNRIEVYDPKLGTDQFFEVY